MAFLEQIQIFGQVFTVRLVENLKDEEGNDLYGRFLPDDHLILIRSNVSTETRFLTLIHELLHACLSLAGGKQSSAEEALITRLEQPLLSLLRGNEVWWK